MINSKITAKKFSRFSNQNRGIKLNFVESTALISSELLELARKMINKIA